MSSDKPTTPVDPTVSSVFSSKIWRSVSSLMLGNQVVDKNRQKINLDMSDITYLMDMDGEGLTYHQILQSFQKIQC